VEKVGFKSGVKNSGMMDSESSDDGRDEFI